MVESLKITTRVKSDRIAKFAFDYATRFGRKQVTAVHKANIMKVGDGLFLESCGAVSGGFFSFDLFTIYLYLLKYANNTNL